MKYLVLVTFLSVTFSSYAGQDEYDQCILKYLKGSKNDVVTHLIKQACQQNYMSPNFTNDGQKAYNQCLLENLPGTESVPAAMEIRNVCERVSKK